VTPGYGGVLASVSSFDPIHSNSQTLRLIEFLVNLMMGVLIGRGLLFGYATATYLVVITQKERSMRNLILILLIALPGLSFADERMDKIETLMKAQGLLEVWQQQIEMGKVEGEKQAKAMIDQVVSQLNPNKKYKDRFKKAFTTFMGKMQGNWTAQQIVEVWAKFYGPKFTNSELDQLISFYTSEIGQKDIKASKVALIEFTQYFQSESKPIMEKALKEYISELRVAAKECECPKNN